MTEIGLETGGLDRQRTSPITLMVMSSRRRNGDASVSNHEGDSSHCIPFVYFWSPRGSRRPLRGLLTMRELVCCASRKGALP